MAMLSFYKVETLPGSPEPNSIYLVKGLTATNVEVYVTSSAGVAFPVEASSIQALTITPGSPDNTVWDLDAGNVATATTGLDLEFLEPLNIRNGNLYRLLITNTGGAAINFTFHATYKTGAWAASVAAGTTTAIMFQAVADTLYMTGLSENM